jgi:hypothetical protein
VETGFELLPAVSSPLATPAVRTPESKLALPVAAAETAPVLPVFSAVPALPTKAELELAELRARVALYPLRTDLQDSVQYEQNADKVTIDILVQTTEEKNKVVAELEGIPLIRSRFRVLADLVPNADIPSTTTSPVEQPNRYPALLEPYLKNELQSTAVVNEVMAAAAGASDDLLHRAFTLSELSARYPPATIAILPPEARLELFRLVQTHLTELEIERRNFQTVVIDLIQSIATAVAEADPADPGNDWTASASALLETARSLHHTCSSLFVDTTQPPAGTLAQLVVRILTLRSRFKAEAGRLQHNLAIHIAQ